MRVENRSFWVEWKGNWEIIEWGMTVIWFEKVH